MADIKLKNIPVTVTGNLQGISFLVTQAVLTLKFSEI